MNNYNNYKKKLTGEELNKVMSNANIRLASPTTMRASLTSKALKIQMESIISDEKKRNMIASSMVAMVQQTPALQECEVSSVFNSALAGASLGLPFGMGHWYAVPYKNKKKGQSMGLNAETADNFKEAQFQLGYKGMIQLALRSGQYRKIIASPIKKGELIKFDPITEDIELRPIMNLPQREQTETMGYYAMFEDINGFRKELYWGIEQMLAHADEYSSAFKKVDYENLQNGKINQKDMWKYSSFWYKNFDEMAKKTMLRQLISKWGVISVEFQNAYTLDQSAVNFENGNLIPEYNDNPKNVEEPKEEESVIPKVQEEEQLTNFTLQSLLEEQ